MNQFELIVRAFIVRDKKILVCQTKGRDYCFLPGGHVEFGETLQAALNRELFEEMGVRILKSKFIGGIENIFVQDGIKRHEISMIFLTKIDAGEIVSQESHVDFYWLTMDEFIESEIAPPAMKDAIVQWTAEKETFFIEEKLGNSS